MRLTPLLGLALAATACVDLPTFDTGEVRVVHLATASQRINVESDLDLSQIASVAFGESSGYLNVVAGPRRIKLSDDTTTASTEISQTVSTATRTSLYVFGDPNAFETIVTDDTAPVPEGIARLRVVHAVPDLEPVDIRIGEASGAALAVGVGFKQATDYVDISPGELSLVITPTLQTSELRSYAPATITPGTAYTLVISGTTNADDAFELSSQLLIDTGDGASSIALSPKNVTSNTARLRLLHTAYAISDVSLSVDDTLAASNIAYGESSGFIEVEAGTRSISILPAGGLSQAITQTFNLAADRAHTLIVYGNEQNLAATIVTTSLSTTPGRAGVHFVQASEEASTLDVKLRTVELTTTATGVAYKGDTSLTLPAGDYQIDLLSSVTEQPLGGFDPVSLASGTNYTVAAIGTVDPSDTVDFGLVILRDTEDNGKNGSSAIPHSPIQMIEFNAIVDLDDVLLRWESETPTMLSFAQGTGYKQRLSGIRRVSATSNGMAVVDHTQVYQPAIARSLFLVGTESNPDVLVVEDDLTPPLTGTTHLRIAQLSPDAPAVTIRMQGGADIWTNLAFKDVTTFVEFPPGPIALEVVDAATPQNVFLTISNVAVAQGQVATLVLRGFATGTPPAAQALSHTLISNVAGTTP